MSIFIAGPVRSLNYVIKLHMYLKCALQVCRFFSVTRTCMHVRWDVREAYFMCVGQRNKKYILVKVQIMFWIKKTHEFSMDHPAGNRISKRNQKDTGQDIRN